MTGIFSVGRNGLERMHVKTETDIADEQAGFWQRRNKRPNHEPHNSNAESSAHQQPLYMCFVDFKKAFDSVSRDKLWITMMEMGYPLYLIDFLAKL